MLREPLAAALRLLRGARGLSQEDFQELIDPRHVHNLEHAKSSVTLDTLENVSTVLTVDPVALLALASSYARGISTEAFVTHLAAELEALKALGVEAGMADEFKDGVIAPRRPGKRTSDEKVVAVLQCKAEGKSQRETARTLDMPTTTVRRIWNRQD